MNILFINTTEPQCGVYQYGYNLHSVLRTDSRTRVSYSECESRERLEGLIDLFQPDFIIYNWQAGIGGWLAGAPFKGIRAKQILLYHDLEARFSDFDAVLFSDPTMKPHDNWYSIGRPLPFMGFIPPRLGDQMTVGVAGFIGAWATSAVAVVLNQLPGAKIRLHLPFATFGDANGNMAKSSAQTCRDMCAGKCEIEVNHEFLSHYGLVSWMSQNHLNCFIRDKGMHWRGVSSVLDAALCAKRPIAINQCSAFRHMFDCSPSICIEDRSLRDILSTGLSPLVPKYVAWRPESVSYQVVEILNSLAKTSA